nr:HVO_2072 family ArtA-dependent S-layer glycoprotein [Halarchaeum rubridurum]
MVLSVFGATVALTGGAAAAQTNASASSVSWDGGSIDNGSTDAVYAFTLDDSSTGNSQDIYLNNVSVSFGGNATASDISSVSVYADTDGNTAFTTSENQLGSSSPSDLSSVTIDTSDFRNNNGDTPQTERYYVAVTTTDGATDGHTLSATPTVGLVNNSTSEIFNDNSATQQLSAGNTFTINTPTSTGDTGSTTNDGGPDHRAAENGSDPAPTDGTSTVNIYPGATVFKGEEDLNFTGGLDSSLTGVSGNAEGTILSPPVPQNQNEGRYTNNGTTDALGVTVNTPRVTELDVDNDNGADISGGSVSEASAETLYVNASWNFQQAEDLELTVEDSSGLEITGDVLKDDYSDNIKNENGEASWAIDLSNQDAGEYTINVEGTEDLDFGAASQTTTLNLNTDDDISVDLGSSSATQGQNVQYTIRGGVAGDTHIVAIDANDLRDSTSNQQATQVFRNVGDVEERGIIADDAAYGPNNDSLADVEADYLYASVEIDDDTGVGVGSIDTQYLDDTSVDVDVYGHDTGVSGVDGNSEEDSASLDVTEGEVTIDSPSGTYVVGSEVEVNGTAPSGLDSVALYARDQGDYELLGDLGTISVDSDGTWSEEDVVLSAQSDIFRITGTYRLGVIDAQDARNDEGNLSDTLTTSEFNSGTSGQTSLRVTTTSLDATFHTVNGQIAQETGTIDVNGTAPGADQVLIGFIGRRGDVITTTTSVDSDDYTFDEDDISVGDLAEGNVHAFAYHIGQDDNVGDGEVPNHKDSDGDSATSANSISGLQNWLESGQGSRDGTQVWNAFSAETVEDTASDDNVVDTTFRLADASTRINTVYTEGNEASGLNPIAVGETAMVMGQTNLQPEDNTITVELMNQDGDTVALTSTEDWSWSGSWSVEMPVGDDVAPGNYTLEVDDGENTDTVDVQVVSELETTTTSTEETSTTSTTTSTEETSTTSTTTTTTTTTTSSSEETSSGSSPGFGVGLALIALAGAALLALRREN